VDSAIQLLSNWGLVCPGQFKSTLLLLSLEVLSRLETPASNLVNKLVSLHYTWANSTTEVSVTLEQNRVSWSVPSFFYW